VADERPAPLQIDTEPSDGAAGRELLAAFSKEIAELYPGWHPGVGPSASPADLSPPRGRFLVAYRADRAVACGALKQLDACTVEIKRVYVVASERGRGLARRMLSELEEAARAGGYTVARLDTGPRQPHALALFRAAGYREIDDYNGNPAASHWLEKQLS
jgi:GNAT superfamily N-acetyltransferase